MFGLLPASIDRLTYPPIVPDITDEGFINLAAAPDRSSDGTEIVEIQQLKSGLSKRHQRVVESMFEYLFPAAQGEGFNYSEPRERAFQDRRVACRSVLRLYLERFHGEEVLALNDAERALKCMDDLHAFRTVFREVDAGRWPYIVGHLSGFQEERFRKEQIEPGLVGVWNLLEYEVEQLPDERMLRNAVFRATRQLFRALIGDPTNTDDIVRRVIPKIQSVGARADFVKLVCRNESGSRIVSERLASELGNRLEPTAGTS